MNKIKSWHVVMLMLSLLILTGCGRGAIQIERERGSDEFLVHVNLNEAEVNELVTESIGPSNPLLRDPQVDLQPGRIVIDGQHEIRRGGATVRGTMVLAPTVESGQLVVIAESVEIEGIPADDVRLQALNERLARRLEALASRGNRDIRVTAVAVDEDTLDLTFTATPR